MTLLRKTTLLNSPVAADEGKLPLATDGGGFTYFGASTDGRYLKWSASGVTWEEGEADKLPDRYNFGTSDALELGSVVTSAFHSGAYMAYDGTHFWSGSFGGYIRFVPGGSFFENVQSYPDGYQTIQVLYESSLDRMIMMRWDTSTGNTYLEPLTRAIPAVKGTALALPTGMDLGYDYMLTGGGYIWVHGTSSGVPLVCRVPVDLSTTTTASGVDACLSFDTNTTRYGDGEGRLFSSGGGTYIVSRLVPSTIVADDTFVPSAQSYDCERIVVDVSAGRVWAVWEELDGSNTVRFVGSFDCEPLGANLRKLSLGSNTIEAVDLTVASFYGGHVFLRTKSDYATTLYDVEDTGSAISVTAVESEYGIPYIYGYSPSIVLPTPPIPSLYYLTEWVNSTEVTVPNQYRLKVTPIDFSTPFQDRTATQPVWQVNPLGKTFSNGVSLGPGDIVVDRNTWIVGDPGTADVPTAGPIYLTGSNSYATGGAWGGPIFIYAGWGYGGADGGAVDLQGGDSWDGANGGLASLRGGSGTVGGDALLQAGAGDTAVDDGRVVFSTKRTGGDIGEFYNDATTTGYIANSATLPTRFTQVPCATGAGTTWTIKGQSSPDGKAGSAILEGGDSGLSDYSSGGDAIVRGGVIYGKILFQSMLETPFTIATLRPELSVGNTFAFDHTSAAYLGPDRSAARTGAGVAFTINAGHGTTAGGLLDLVGGNATSGGTGGAFRAGSGTGAGTGGSGDWTAFTAASGGSGTIGSMYFCIGGTAAGNRVLSLDANKNATFAAGLTVGYLNETTISPSITGSVNDYAPTGWSTATVIRLSADSTGYSVTGFDASATAVRKTLVNVGSNSITVSNENVSSSAANRIITTTGADVTLAANGALDLVYDSTTSRWRVY